MILRIIKDSWTAKDKTFYVFRYAVLDESNNVVRKGDPIIWLTEEQYNSIKF